MSIDAYAATQRYIYVGLSNNYHKWKDASQWGINHWGGTGGGVVPGSKITDLKTTITHSGCTFHMYRMYVYDDNKNFEFKGSDNWWDCKKENISISGTTTNALLFRDNDGGDGGSPTFYQTNYQEESIVSLSVSSNSVSVGEEVILTPTLTSNAEYNEITSTTYSVGTGATVSNGKFVATAAGTYTVTATITYNPKKFTGITKKVENITCEIVVSEVAIPHPVTSVTVAPTSVTIKQGATVTLTATVAPSNADDPSVTWSSDNNSVATVVNGVVTAVAVGTANITVTTVDGGFTATCAVKVKPLQYTFYAINSAQWPTVAAHYWEGADGGSAWLGADMVKESETINGFDIYSITISSDFVNIMFTNQIDGDKNKKTADLTTEGNDGKYYDIKDAKWYASLSEVPVPFDYYVIGTINGWAMGDANYGMKDDNKDGVYEKQITLAAGDHVIKVNDGTWDKQWQFSNLTATYVGVTEGTDDQGNKNGNIAIHLDAETTITIKLNPTKNELTLDGLTIDAPVVTYDYYVVGTINGWGLKDASYGMELSGDVYEKEVAFAIGKHELKINNGTWDNANTFGYDNLSVAYEGVSRGSGDGDNNIVIDLAEAKTIAIKFDNNTKKITLEGLTQIHTVKATVNPAETGSVEGAKTYKHGEQATLIATAAEGYEFVNWTVGGKEVSAKNPYEFTVTENVDLVANFKKAATEVVLENAYKEVYTIMNRANFFGEHATYGDISVQVNNYNGYGTYAEGVSSRIDGVKVNGSATFENKGETDLLTATLTDAEGTVYIVKAEVAAPKTYNVVATEAQYTKAETGAVTYTVTGLSVDKENYTLTIYAMEEGNEASMGEEGAIQGLVELSEVEGVLTVTGTLKDAAENKYVLNFTATPKASETYTLTFEDMVIEPGQWDDNLHITAENAEYAIEFQLFGGKNKGYGEYGFTDGYPDVDEVYINFEYAQLKEGTVAKYYKNEETGLATIEATFLLGIDTYIVTLTGEPLVNPEEIVPTDTINITMTEGTIGLVYGMVKVAASSEEAELSILLVGEDPYNATTNEFAASSYLVTTAGSLTFLRGGLEIVEVGDVKIAYIGVLCSDHKWYNIVLTTGTEAPTALDNLNTTVAPVKMIENGQLIIVKDGVQYNAQGAILK